MTNIARLYILQQIDSKLTSNANRVIEIRKTIADTRGIDAIISECKDLEKNLNDAKKNNVVIQGEIDVVISKKDAAEKRLYSGLVSNPKELTDLENQGIALNRRVEVLEDKKLEIMILEEDAEEIYLNKKKFMLSEVEARNVLIGSLDNELNDLKVDESKLLAERDVAVNGLESELIEKYEKARRRFNGIAVSLVNEGVCAACGLMVSTARIQDARSGDKLGTCDGCNRFLYVK